MAPSSVYAQQVLSDTIFLHECARNECGIAKEIAKRGFLQANNAPWSSKHHRKTAANMLIFKEMSIHM